MFGLTVRALALATVLIAAGCSEPPAAAPPIATSSPTPSATATRIPVASGLASPPHAIVGPVRAWYLVPDGFARDTVHLAVTFPDGDPTAGTPRARLRSNGRVVALERTPGLPASWQAELPLDAAPPGDQRVEILVRLANGQDEVVGQRDFKLSAPVYVVWTLDFEGDAATDGAMGNAAGIADAHKAPMTLMWNPRVWTTNQVSAAQASAMLAWTTSRRDQGDEIALHIHAWTDFVRAAGVIPRTSPSWAGRSDGYDVPLTAFDESETAKLLDYALRLMAEHGMPRPTAFRAGGLFANAANLRAVAAAGFTADTSATGSGPFGVLQLPWTLAQDAQPYRPSRTDANAAGDLPLLEVPNNAGNTYGYTASSVQRIVNDDVAMLPRIGEIAAARRALTFVSHPATIDATERAAIDKLFAAFEPYRWDRDTGPLRYVTLSQLAKAYAP